MDSLAFRPQQKVAIHGALGRMGQTVLDQALAARWAKVVALYERPDHPFLGTPEVRSGVTLTAPWQGEAADLVVDFSSPAALQALVSGWQGSAALVSGTTGLSAEQKASLQELAQRVPVLWAPNMSMGIVVLQALVEKAAILLGTDYDAEILEMHHRHKVDAPSGTAMALAGALQRVRPDAKVVTGRDGTCGPRTTNEIGVMALRGGDVVGEHEVILAGNGESIRLRHVASHRGVFASGALRFGRWLLEQPPGFYTPTDWTRSLD